MAKLRRIAVLTAGGDTPALNATIYGVVERANALRIEVYGIMRGFAGVLEPELPHVELNPLFCTIPELVPTLGGTLLGASRTYIDPEESAVVKAATHRLERLGIEGLICIGGDGTINGMQPISEFFPCVLAPKTIDNDLGLNYIDEPNEVVRDNGPGADERGYRRISQRETIDLEDIVNYATPGYATAVFVVAQSIERLRTTAESHRRIGIIEVMGRQSGYIALGSVYGQPDIILLPEVPLDVPALERRVRELYELQRHVVIVIGEGVVDETGQRLGDVSASADPAGNIRYSGAAECLKQILARQLGDDFFRSGPGRENDGSAIFTRKVGHTQRGGRPIRFDRFYASQLGGEAVDLLVQGHNNSVATLQWSGAHGFQLSGLPANKLRDRWGIIHPRRVHQALYDAKRFQPSKRGRDFLKPIFTNALGAEDTEHMLADLFNPGKLRTRYQSVNVDIQKRIQHLAAE